MATFTTSPAQIPPSVILAERYGLTQRQANELRDELRRRGITPQQIRTLNIPPEALPEYARGREQTTPKLRSLLEAEQPAQTYRVRSLPAGQIGNVMVKPQAASSYQAIEAMRSKPAPEEKTKQTAQIAVSRSDVERFNLQAREAGIGTAGEFFAAYKSGALKETSQGYELTKSSPEAQRIYSYEPSPAYFGAKEYFTSVGKSGVQDIKGYIKDFDIKPLKERRAAGNVFDFRAVSGSAKVIYGVAGAGLSIVLEPAVYTFLGESKTQAGLTEEEARFYNQIRQAEITKQAEAGIQTGFLSTGLTGIKYSTSTPFKTKVEYEPYEFVKPLKDTRIIRRAEEPSIIKGFAPKDETFGLVKPAELQSQLYPKTLIEETSVFAPPKYVPEYLMKLGREKYQAKFGIEPERTIGVTKEEVFKVFREEQPTTQQLKLLEAAPETFAPKPSAFEIEAVPIEVNGKKMVFLKNKKGQLQIIQPGSVYEKFATFKPETKTPFTSVSPAETEVLKPQTFKVATSPFLSAGYSFLPETTTRTYTLPLTKTESIMASIESAKIKTDTLTGTTAAQRIYSATRPKSDVLSRLAQDQAAIQGSVAITGQMQTQAQIQQPIKTTQQITNLETLPPPSNIYRFTPKPPRTDQKPPEQPRPVPPLPRLKFDLNKNVYSPGFKVQVRRGGIFKTIKSQALTKEQALGFGARIVEETPAASFRLIKVSEPGKKQFGLFTSSLENFYKKGDVFIEKPGKRINMIGEVRGITFAPRRKKMFKKIFRGF